MISVVIPALNEAATIAAVVEFAWRAPGVRQVVVVDDGSVDDTAALAFEAGAEVITSSMLGKGASMHDGLLAATQEIIVYLDGDLSGLNDDLIPSLTAPLLADEADFVKARFARSGGRVTALTARPLLRCFFPELATLEQPLGGIMAARRSLLEQLEFEGDFGVDVGLVIDAAMAGARLAEVDVGSIEHCSRPLHGLLAMAFQVASTILERAARHGLLQPGHVRGARLHDRRESAEQPERQLQRCSGRRGLALFDMDGVLLQGRYVVELARRCGKTAALGRLLDAPSLTPEVRTQRIAALFRGVPFESFEQVARTIPLSPGATETVVALRRLGYCVGLVTDSYAVAADVIRRRVFADFCVGHLLHFQGANCRGRLSLAPFMEHFQGCPEHQSCKFNVLLNLLDHAPATPDPILAIGDSENDICLLQAADYSFAFEPKTLAVAAAAQHVIHGDLREVLRVLDQVPQTIDAPLDALDVLNWNPDYLRQTA